MVAFKQTQSGVVEDVIYFIEELFDVCLSALGESAPSAVRLEGLKLLGALLGALAQSNNPEVHTLLLENKFLLVHEKLEIIRNIDESSECRNLADKYFSLLLPSLERVAR